MRRGASQPIRHSVCPCRHHVAHSVSVLTYLSLSPILPFSRSTVFSNRISPSTFTLHYLSLQSFVSLFFRPAFSPSSIGRSTSSLQKPNDMKLTRSRSWSRNPEEPTLGKMYLLCIFENQSRPSTAHPWHTESHRLWVSTSFPNFPGMKTSPYWPTHTGILTWPVHCQVRPSYSRPHRPRPSVTEESPRAIVHLHPLQCRLHLY